MGAVAETEMGENPKDDDRFARMFFGEDSNTGSVRMLVYIALFIVICGTLFWWLRTYQGHQPS
jgi:hypothetical protein